MDHSQGLESLVQRGRSPFYKEMVSLHQDIQKLLPDHPHDNQHDIYLFLKNLDYSRRLKALIKKHMGIAFSNIIIIESLDANMMSEVRVNSSTKRQVKQKIKSPGMLMEEISRVYDDRAGKLDKLDSDQMAYGFALYINTAWWVIRNKDGSLFFDPSEISAVVMHEVGHTDHYIRTLNKVYNHTLDASDIIDYVGSHYDRESTLALISALKRSRYLDRSWLKVLETTEKYFTTSNSGDDPYYWEALSMLGAVVTSEVAGQNLQYYLMIEDSAHQRLLTKANLVDAERSADEFSARHGSYADLVAAISKFSKLDTVDSSLFYSQFLWKSPAAICGSLTNFVSLFNLNPENVSNGYDPLIKRLTLIVETAKHAFHDADLPDDVKSDIKAQILECEKYIREYESSSHHQVRKTIKTWKDNVVKLGRAVALPVRSRLSDDYEKLQNANRSLSRHPLYYLANK